MISKVRRDFLLVLGVLLGLGSGALAQTAVSFPGSTAVGQSTAATGVTVTMISSGVAAAPQVLLQGLANADYVAAGGTCAAGVSYSVGSQCTVQVVFQPRYPGVRRGAAVVRATDGHLLGMTQVTGIAKGSLPVLAPGQIDTVAGDTEWVFQGDGGLATQTSIFLPTGVVVDGTGNMFLSDSQNNRVRRVDAVTRTMTTVAGNGTPGYQGDGVAGTSTMISTPAGLALDGAGNLYFADTGNHIIRRVDAVTGVITTVAGSPGVQGYTGDGGAATEARLSFPEGIAFDLAGDLIIADTGNSVVREVDAASGAIRTIAGTGVPGYNGDGRAAVTAMLNSPWNLAVAQDGTLYIADLNNDLVRRVDASGTIQTVAGNGTRGYAGDGGAPAAAMLNEPTAVAIDPAGDVYIADSGNNRVREINAANGLLTTISGNASEQFTGDAGPANLASLYGPSSLYFTSAGDLYIADMFHNRIRRINAGQTTLSYATIKVGKVSAPQAVQLANAGNAALTLKAPALLNAAEDAATTTCNAGALIAPANVCNLGAAFAPTVIGNPVNGSIGVSSDAIYTAPTILMSGQVLSITPTTTALVSNANPSLVGAAVTFMATVTNDGSALTGTVAFLDGTAPLCSATVTADVATCTVSTLGLGQHSVTASYSGDANNAASVSPALLQVVKQQAAAVLAVVPNPAVVTGTVTLTATVTAPTGTPGGSVTFSDGTTALGSAALGVQGTASYTTTQLTPGTHALSAQYGGDAVNAPATSNAVQEVVQQATTITTLAASSMTATVGVPVTLTAQVTSTNGPAPTGTVQFNAGTTPLGSATVSANGTASFAVSSLAPGAQTVAAVYSGDTNDATSSSAPLVLTIQQVVTSTTLAADANPVNAGATLHLTAVVSAALAGAGVPAGNVTFTDGPNTLGAVAVDATGHAVLSVATLASGSHAIVASYGGSTNDAASQSAVLTEVVQTTATTTTLSANAAATLAGMPAVLTASVTSGTGVPGGAVSFMDGTATLGEGTLNAQGQAVFSTTALSVGTHALTAVYAAGALYAGGTSAALAHTVSLAVPMLTLAAPGAPVDAGTMVPMPLTLSSNGVPPTGSLTLRDGGTTIGSQTVAADGTFTFANVSLAVGTHMLTAVYSGDADNAAASSAAVPVIVQLAPTATALTSSASPSLLGQSVTFTAAVTSDSASFSGSMSFMDGSTVLASAPVGANGVATFATSTLAFGTHHVVAAYQGDTNHAASSSPALAEQIVEPVVVSLASSANPALAGANVTFSVGVAGSGAAVPTGTVVLLDGAATLATLTLDGSGAAVFSTAGLAVGTHALAVKYAGDTNYYAAVANLVQVVQVASTQVLLTASANPATYGAALVLSAKVTDNGGIASGTVSFADGGMTIGTGVLDATGLATLTSNTLAPGVHTITANYNGNGSEAASTSAALVVSVKQTATVAVASSANPSPTLSAITLTAAVSNSGAAPATGMVTFTDGATQLGTATLNASGQAVLTLPSLAVGTHAIQASYGGDAGDFAAVSAALAQVVQLRPTSVALTAVATDPQNPLQTTLIAVVRWTGPGTPTGAVTFTAGTQMLGSMAVDATGVATLSVVLESASESIVATYGGDTAYAASSSAATTISPATAPQLTMQMNPGSATIASKQHVTVNLTITSSGTFADTLQLGCNGLPYAATCTFSSPQVKLAAGATTTVQVVVDTGDALGAGASAKLEPKRGSGVLLCLLPFAALLGLGARRRRIRRATMLLGLLLMAGALHLTGCSALQVNGTPAGVYPFKMTAVGMGTGVTSSATMTLTVTQ